MKTFSASLCVIVLLFSCMCAAHADYLEVRRSATVRTEPDREAAALEQVASGARLELLDEGRQTKGYYHVRTVALGQSGWIYRTFVRRYTGEVPAPTPEAAVTDRLADPTATLTPQQRGWAAHHLRLGKPQAVYERVREGYVVAQDARLKIPVWVQYELTRADLHGPASRSDDFKADASIPVGSRAELPDYQGSELDRGHMAPAEDMDRSSRVMSESFLLSNMAPQVGIGFNRHIWSYLEAAIRGWVEQRGTLTIITGPVFAVEGGAVSYKVIGENHVAVPSHFYKIVVDANNPNRVEALAFLLPNKALSDHHYEEFLVSIDEIEKATGLNFLSELSATVQNAVESQKAPQVW